MVSHRTLVPDREGLPLAVSMEALRVARLRQTNVPGDIATDGTIDASSMNLTDDLYVKGVAIKNAVDKMKPQIDQAVKDATDAADKADELTSQITDVRKTVTDQGVKLEGAITKADQAVSASSETSQSLTELKSTVENHYKDQQATEDRVTTVEQTANGLTARVQSNYETANSALAQASAAILDIDGFKTEVTQTYATKDGVTADISSAVTQSADKLDAKFTTKTNALGGEVASLQTLIRMDSNGVHVGQSVKDADGRYVQTGNSAVVGSDGFFRVDTAPDANGNIDTVFKAGQNLVQVNGPNNEERLTMGVEPDSNDHFYVRIKSLNSGEPDQLWQTGWMDLKLYSGGATYAGCTARDGFSHFCGYRGGALMFTGRVVPNKSNHDMRLNADDFYPFRAVGFNRNFMTWGQYTDGTLVAVNTYVPANAKYVCFATANVAWNWVSLDNLVIPL